MGFPAVLRTFLMVFIGAVFVKGIVDDMGACKKLCKFDRRFDFDEYATMNGGKWKYQLVPSLPFFDHIKYAGVEYKPTGINGVYDITIYNILKNGTRETFSDGRVSSLGNGFSINNATENGEGNIIFQSTYLKYEPGLYVYYYVCTKDGGDSTTDYRNVLVQKKLSKKIVASINKLDRKFGFNNKLMELDVQDDESESL